MATQRASDDWRSLPLWQHQVTAIEMIQSYLSAALVGSALVRMPTGVGKSGIITVASRCLSEARNILVVCPHEMFREQLAEDVKERFFTNIGASNDRWEKHERLQPSALVHKGTQQPFAKKNLEERSLVIPPNFSHDARWLHGHRRGIGA